MVKKLAKVDAYIAKSQPFAQPILKYVRDVVHAACPETEEAIKWGCPFFLYKGILCSMAGFKQHCMLIFWHKGMREVVAKLGSDKTAGSRFAKITSLKDLPPKGVLSRMVRQAVALHDEGMVSIASRPRKARPLLKVPADLQAALKRDKKAQQTFQGFTPARRNDYVEWIVEAKRPETRAKRLATAVEWMAAGKSRNWKYERKAK